MAWNSSCETIAIAVVSCETRADAGNPTRQIQLRGGTCVPGYQSEITVNDAATVDGGVASNLFVCIGAPQCLGFIVYLMPSSSTVTCGTN